MGNFRVEIEAVGGHGCAREIKDGRRVYGCGQRGCVDCEAREFVKFLERQGYQVVKAELTHWPGSETEVKDDLKTGIRKGNFS